MNERGIYRPLYTALWDDDEWKKVPPNAKLVFVCLRTCRLTNMACISVFGDGERLTVSQMTGLKEKDVKIALRYLSDTHWIAYRRGILWIRNGLKFDPVVSLNNEKHVRGVEIILKSLPKDEIILNFCDHYKLAYPFDTPSIPLRIPIPNDTDTEYDTEHDTENEAAGFPAAPPPPILKDPQKEIERVWIEKGFDVLEGRLRFDPQSKIDFAVEKQKILNWVAENPPKKKWGAFVTNWLNRAMTDNPKAKQRGGLTDADFARIRQIEKDCGR